MADIIKVCQDKAKSRVWEGFNENMIQGTTETTKFQLLKNGKWTLISKKRTGNLAETWVFLNF